jgi:hypothetical protein
MMFVLADAVKLGDFTERLAAMGIFHHGDDILRPGEGIDD